MATIIWPEWTNSGDDSGDVFYDPGDGPYPEDEHSEDELKQLKDESESGTSVQGSRTKRV